ncbi:MAG TPA: rod-binding protein [Xanthobacteraceae bacterium]
MAASALDGQRGLALDALAQRPRSPLAAGAAKARAAAQDFEAVFLNSMFQNMFTGIAGDGPLGTGTSLWRSFLTDEYAKVFARAGGIGLADDVYRSLLAQQEARAATMRGSP